MRIIKEDDQELIFVVYPSKTFLITMLLVIAIFLITLLISSSATSRIYNFTETTKWWGIAVKPVSFIMLLLFLIHLILSYVFPIRVSIDKKKKELQYRDFSLLLRTSDFIKKVKIDTIAKLLNTVAIPEVYKSFAWDNNVRFDICKFCFILKNGTSIPIYSGSFSYNRHEAAFKKIAAYLNLPYEREGYTNNNFPSSKMLKVMIWAMIALAVIVTLLVGLVYLGQHM